MSGERGSLTDEPLVSVVIPTYNRAELLSEAVASVRAQTYQRFELIVADDGSTDATVEKIAAFRDPRVRHVRLEHNGRPSVARNRALDAARGELVAFVDDDDLWEPHKLEKQVAVFRGAPKTGFCYTDIRRLSEDGKLSGPVLQPFDKWEGKIFDRLLLNSFLFVSAVMIRRRIIDAAGPFDESLPVIEDFDLWLRVTFVADTTFIDEPLTIIRRHPQGISSARELLVHQHMVLVLQRVGKRLPLSVRQRLTLRRALARSHTRLGLYHLEHGNVRRGRQCLVRSLVVNPVQRAAWSSLGRSVRRVDAVVT